MNRIVFSREGEIRPAAVAGVGLLLSAIAFAGQVDDQPKQPKGAS